MTKFSLSRWNEPKSIFTFFLKSKLDDYLSFMATANDFMIKFSLPGWNEPHKIHHNMVARLIFNQITKHSLSMKGTL